MTSKTLKRPTDKEATINEIRTQRLSRVLQAMDNRSSSAPRLNCPARVAGAFHVSDHPDDEESEVVADKLRKQSLTRTHSSSTADDVDSLFRSRTSSITRNQFRSLRIQTPREASLDKTKNDTNGNDREPDSEKRRKSPELSPPALACETLNRFVRHLIPRYDSLQAEQNEQPAKRTSHHRARTITICGRVQQKATKSPSPTPRIRAETESGAKIESKARKVTHPQTSKSSSAGSSGSLSPMQFMGFAGGMLGRISSDQQVSPGPPLSPSCSNGKFTVLVVGSKNVGKTALINRFLETEIRKGTPHYDAGSVGDDNSVSVMVDDEEARLRFIEVNNEESDLWLSLSGAAYVVLYNFDDTSSFRNATEVVARLRERNDTAYKPIMLVSNKQTIDRKRFLIANDDGRQVAKQNHCKFYEIYVSAGRSADDLLIAVTQEVRCYYLQRRAELSRARDVLTEASLHFDHAHSIVSGLGVGLFHVRTSSASSASSTASKTSSLSGLGQRLWPRRKVKLSKSAEAPEDLLLRVYGYASLANGLHDSLFGERRGSRSLEALPTTIK